MESLWGLDPDAHYPPPHLRPVVMGVDIGKKVDHTAFAVAELDHGQSEDLPRFLIRDFVQLPLGTPYPVIGDKMVAAIRAIRGRDVGLMRQYLMDRDGHRGTNETYAERREITVRIDASGVGEPVVDAIRRPLRELDVRVEALMFVTGERLTDKGATWSMGKAYLVSRLMVVFEGGRVEIDQDHPLRDGIIKEAADYQVRIERAGRAKYGAMESGTHDDMITALGLAVLKDTRRQGPSATAAEISEVMYGSYGDPWGGGGDPYQ